VGLLALNSRRALGTPDARGLLPVHCAAAAAAAAANGDPARALEVEVVRFLVKEDSRGLRSPVSCRSVPLAHLAERGEPPLEVLQHLSEKLLPRDLRMPSIERGGWRSCMMDALDDMVRTIEFILLVLVEPPSLHLPCSDGRLPLHLAAERAASLEMVQ
jgi:hypothetical protein